MVNLGTSPYLRKKKPLNSKILRQKQKLENFGKNVATDDTFPPNNISPPPATKPVEGVLIFTAHPHRDDRFWQMEANIVISKSEQGECKNVFSIEF